MKVFDGRNKNWNLESNVEDNDRYIWYENITSWLNQNSKCDINIDSRIGMESTMGEVYKLTLGNYSLAAKLLPILNDGSFLNNKKEIEFAIQASDLVLKNKSIYFPLVYDFTFCKETYFYGSKHNMKLRFYEKSLRYQQFRQLLDSTPDESIKSQIILYRQKFMDPEYIKQMLKLSNVNLANKISSHILFSELACFDLDYYLENNVLSNKGSYYLLKHIFLSIQDLQTKLHIMHGDLHLGNILMIKNNKSEIGFIPLIHDFGRSKRIKNENYDKQHDIFFFIGKFIEKINNQSNNLSFIIQALDEVDNVYHNSKEYYPIIDIVKYWTNIEI